MTDITSRNGSPPEVTSSSTASISQRPGAVIVPVTGYSRASSHSSGFDESSSTFTECSCTRGEYTCTRPSRGDNNMTETTDDSGRRSDTDSLETLQASAADTSDMTDSVNSTAEDQETKTTTADVITDAGGNSSNVTSEVKEENAVAIDLANYFIRATDECKENTENEVVPDGVDHSASSNVTTTAVDVKDVDDDIEAASVKSSQMTTVSTGTSTIDCDAANADVSFDKPEVVITKESVTPETWQQLDQLTRRFNALSPSSVAAKDIHATSPSKQSSPYAYNKAYRMMLATRGGGSTNNSNTPWRHFASSWHQPSLPTVTRTTVTTATAAPRPARRSRAASMREQQASETRSVASSTSPTEDAVSGCQSGWDLTSTALADEPRHRQYMSAQELIRSPPPSTTTGRMSSLSPNDARANKAAQRKLQVCGQRPMSPSGHSRNQAEPNRRLPVVDGSQQTTARLSYHHSSMNQINRELSTNHTPITCHVTKPLANHRLRPAASSESVNKLNSKNRYLIALVH